MTQVLTLSSESHKKNALSHAFIPTAKGVSNMDFNLLFDSKNNHIQTTVIDYQKSTSTLDFFKLTIYSNSIVPGGFEVIS